MRIYLVYLKYCHYLLYIFHTHNLFYIYEINYEYSFLSLKYKESNKAITKNVDKEDKIQFKNMEINFKIKQQPDTIYINESGLYSLLLSSRTQKANAIL